MVNFSADETKAANHIDFTSVPYEGPALKKGQELLAQSREQVKQETAKGPSLQRGWYYSGQLDHMVLWEKDKASAGNSNPMYKTCNTMYGSQPTMAEGTFAPGAPKEYMDAKMANGVDGKFSTHLGLAGMPRASGLNTDKTRSKAAPDPTAWGYHSLSNF